MVRIRRACAADASQIADVHVRAWQAGYRELLPAEYLDALNAQDRAARYTFGIPLPDGPVTLVATADDGAIEGLVTIGRCRDEGFADHGEVWALYVDPDRWRVGMGRSLMEAGREALHSNLFRSVKLWVMTDNVRARRFYEVNGWRADGTTRTQAIGTTPVSEVRYRLVLA